MNVKLTPELREAIDAQCGRPVFIVDADRHETFVLLTTGEYRQVEHYLGHAGDDEEWSEEKNTRRCDLIDKEIAGTLTDAEQAELAHLQRQAETYFDKVAPPPLEGARRLHQQLLQKRRDSQS